MNFFKKNWIDLSCVFFLIILSCFLFRLEFFGYQWIGNSDRLNSDLKVTRHYLSSPKVNAWDENEMMGYDSFVLPYTYPSILIDFIKLFGMEEELKVMGFLVIVWLSLAGIAAYLCIRSYVNVGLAAITGAICYQFSSLTLLKVSQNTMSFSVFIVFPLLILCLKRMNRRNYPNQFLFLSILLSMMLGFMFLQKAAYVLIVVGLYAAWRSLISKQYWIFGVFSGAVSFALIFSAPRIAGVFHAMQEYARLVPGINFKDFEQVYAFQNIRPYEILRWFDSRIFGSFPSDAAKIQNNINLSEGFLIYTSAIIPWLLLFGVSYGFVCWKKFFKKDPDFVFFIIIFICTVLVSVWKPATKFIYYMFLGIDFTHARILIAGLLPLCIIVAFILQQIELGVISTSTRRQSSIFGKIILYAFAVVVAFVFNIIIEYYASFGKGSDFFGYFGAIKIQQAALQRVQWNFYFFIMCLVTFLLAKKTPELKKFIFVVLCSFISIQCYWNANYQINGQYVFNFQNPFFMGDMYYANRDEFVYPSAIQKQQLNRKVHSEHYRVVLICDHRLANGFCAGHVPEYWGLRAIDGYYGIGVPKRLALLPWGNTLSLRSLSFEKLTELPWDLLGFLNVKYALIVENQLYRNIGENGKLNDTTLNVAQVVQSAARVTPRAFFASKIEPVATAEDARRKIFGKNKIVNPQNISFVENLGRMKWESMESTRDTAIVVEGNGDYLLVRFQPSIFTRFLVLNELYYPGWQAETMGKSLKIYPSNVVMRGVFVPPGANYVKFRYTSISEFWIWRQFKKVLWVLLCLIFVIMKWHQKVDS